jgi:hypothetical protein
LKGFEKYGCVSRARNNQHDAVLASDGNICTAGMDVKDEGAQEENGELHTQICKDLQILPFEKPLNGPPKRSGRMIQSMHDGLLSKKYTRTGCPVKKIFIYSTGMSPINCADIHFQHYRNTAKVNWVQR